MRYAVKEIYSWRTVTFVASPSYRREKNGLSNEVKRDQNSRTKKEVKNKEKRGFINGLYGTN